MPTFCGTALLAARTLYDLRRAEDRSKMAVPTNTRAILLAVFIAFGGFLFGYDIGVISVRSSYLISGETLVLTYSRDV